MSIRGFDHVALPVSDLGATVAFYARLGFDAPDPSEWSDSPPPFATVRAGENGINFHAPALWESGHFTLRGPAAKPGCGDLCFVWNGPVDSLLAHLRGANVDVHEGPVDRVGGRGLPATSVYVRDPDDNLLEFLVYRD